MQIEIDGQVDVVGHVTACEELDNYDKNGSKGKKKLLTRIDAEGNELKCMLWGVFAQQFNDFLKANLNHGKMCVQNGYHGTKLFLFNTSEIIEKDEFRDVEAYRLRLFSRQDDRSGGTKIVTSNPFDVLNMVEKDDEITLCVSVDSNGDDVNEGNNKGC